MTHAHLNISQSQLDFEVGGSKQSKAMQSNAIQRLASHGYNAIS